MTSNRLPNDGPIGGRIDFGGHGPIRTRSSLALDAVDRRCQLAKGGLISLPLVASPRQIVQLSNAVRRERIRLRAVVDAVSAVGGAHDRGGRELRDGNVVRVPVRSLRTKGYDHIG